MPLDKKKPPAFGEGLSVLSLQNGKPTFTEVIGDV